MHRFQCAAVAAAFVVSAGSSWAQAPAGRRTPPGQAAAGQAAPATPAPGAAAAPGATAPQPAPGRPGSAAVAPAAALPDPPIPAQHALQAGIGQCAKTVDQLSRSALSVPYNAQSLWNQGNPPQHVFQSVIGVHNPKNNPPGGMVAIIAAPVAPETCDAVAVEVYPLAGTCAEVQKLMSRGGEIETTLQDIKVMTDAQKRRLFLLPGFGNTCVAVSVNSFFGGP